MPNIICIRLKGFEQNLLHKQSSNAPLSMGFVSVQLVSMRSSLDGVGTCQVLLGSTGHSLTRIQCKAGDRKFLKSEAFSGTLTRSFHANPHRWLAYPFIYVPYCWKILIPEPPERSRTMQARRLIGKPWAWASPKPPLPAPGCLGRRLMVIKPPTRAAVHGVKLPVPDILDVCF